jgi:type II secretory pathway component PulF
MEENRNIRISDSERISLISNLCTMLTAGIPILEAVDSILEDAKGGPKKILETLKEDVVQGRHIHTSFAKFPEVFDKVTVNVIKASEEAGTLDVTLKDLKESIAEQVEFNDKVRSALTYPAFLLVVFTGILLLNLVFVIPKITTVFINLRVALPLPTRILLFVSNIMLKYTFPFLGVVAIIIGVFVFLFVKRRRMVLSFIYSLPLVNNLVKLIDITRFSRSLHLLLSSGITITEGLELTSEVVMRKETADVINKSREFVLAGKPFSQGLRTAKGYIPIIMIKLVEAGEKTGTLESSMQDISDYFDYQVTNTLKTLTALLEPVMLVVVGVIVGGLMVSIIAPIYSLISKVGVR